LLLGGVALAEDSHVIARVVAAIIASDDLAISEKRLINILYLQHGEKVVYKIVDNSSIRFVIVRRC
jgi:hypothetical protein